jgi:hypothetical protein
MAGNIPAAAAGVCIGVGCPQYQQYQQQQHGSVAASAKQLFAPATPMVAATHVLGTAEDARGGSSSSGSSCSGGSTVMLGGETLLLGAASSGQGVVTVGDAQQQQQQQQQQQVLSLGGHLQCINLT